MKKLTGRMLIVLCALCAVLLASQSLNHGLPARAQDETAEQAFARKSDLRLKHVYQSFRRAAPDELSTSVAERRAERDEQRKLARVEERADGTASVGVVLRLRDEAAAAEVEASGFALRTQFGDLAVATVAVDELPKLAALDAVVRLQAATVSRLHSAKPNLNRAAPMKPALTPKEMRAFNDAANQAVRAPDARRAFNVSGRGVVVGVVDTGIDWRHGDFRRADGTTRIKYLWDISDPASSGPGGVGRLYSEAEINAALRGAGTVNERDRNGHGTHVAGIAAGNGLGTGNGYAPGTFAGIAPEADLVIVKAVRGNGADGGFGNDDVIAALAFVRAAAAQLNEPFVINLSLGSQLSLHDGSDPEEVAIDNLLGNGAGRQVTIAAGNEGDEAGHVGGFVGQGRGATIPFTTSGEPVGLFGVYSSPDLMTVSVIKPNGATIGPVGLNSQAADNDVAIENGDEGNGVRSISVAVKRPLAGQWQLVVNGARINDGRIDLWSVDDGATRFENGVSGDRGYCGTPATSKLGIAVANYVTKTQWTNLNGGVSGSTSQGLPGQAAASSSPGPTRDARIKPEIASPGTFLISARSADATFDPAQLFNDGGRHVADAGTSMAAPVTAGAVALMLQINRNLTSTQLKHLLWYTVDNDGFTGDSISFKFGYGKLNVYDAVNAAANNFLAAEFVSVLAASYAPDTVAAPDAMMAGFGANLATRTEAAASLPLPTTLAGVSVRIDDGSGDKLAPLFFVSPGQINYVIPSSLGRGLALVRVVRNGSVVAAGGLTVNNVWPGLFTANASGRGLGSAVVVRVKSNGQQIYESAAQPIDLSNSSDRVILVVFGTGLRGRSDLQRVRIFIGGELATPLYAGAQNDFAGLDQLNFEIPRSLAGRGQINLRVYADNWEANTVQFTVR